MGHSHETPQKATKEVAAETSGSGPNTAPAQGNSAAAQDLDAPSSDGLGSTLDAAAAEGGRAHNKRDPASFSAAIDKNKASHGWARAIIEDNRSKPADGANPQSRANVLRNTAQWLDAGQARLELLTYTHDSHLRSGLDDKQVAYFQAGIAHTEGPGTYSPVTEGHDDRAGLEIDRRNIRGGLRQSGTLVKLYEPRGKRDMEETLIHEVQHDADLHVVNDDGTGQAFAEDLDHKALTSEPYMSDSQSANYYKSEFRAYWMGDLKELGSAEKPGYPLFVQAKFDGKSAIANTNFKNERQSDIFAHMRKTTGVTNNVWASYDDGWAHPYAHFFQYYAFDKSFKKMVDAYDRPSGGNMINSVRIQAMSDALLSKDVKAVMDAALALDDGDRTYLSDRKLSHPFWTLVGRSLKSFDDIEMLVDIIDDPRSSKEKISALANALAGSGAAGAAAIVPNVVVQRGDTLKRIAERELGDADRWTEIYEMNREVIGDNPNHIRRGQELRLP